MGDKAEGGFLAALKERLAQRGFRPDPDLPPLQGGAAGYVSYDAVAEFEPRVRLKHEQGTPSAAFMISEKLLVFDNLRRTVTVIVAAIAQSGSQCYTKVSLYRMEEESSTGITKRIGESI